jgi:uncharacterized protein (TIGR02217 family)
MTFRNQPLDECISDGAVGGPEFITLIAGDAESETRDALRSKARGYWDLAFAARLEENWRPLRAHWLVMGGRRDTWPFKDKLDFQCAASESVLVVLTANTTWQMYKRHSIGGITYDYKIVLPYSTTVSGGGTYTVGATTGIITRTGGANPTGFVTSFRKLCRYDTDSFRPRSITHKPDGTQIVEWVGIPVKEVLV